ncbi:EAL domain-containing protein [Halothiobacillus neapolitanus]|uniref:Diguanylate cyclase/phosphodiesterase with PAS/PAC sensor(S) n=1 Tax=Halothiobacillus neapolitanus (strain ATCC 23641 / DSM 15147 / CIP 104769 / NCIMB 8539 / c2) TaxID=555778 RepID=D0L1D4_HALNC|nr:EAL domain-containing protein [Halothiobacillus neapolitanus]ACX96507.1 diguanylate cyclase/phosphodiesterase with PAS/PAC sensor(s) [Halothiobacillus neapolitanus c2]TDN65385.1 diguanylate cyclase (GGDEF)-like protein [Halothiobacillus neapolitanus]
MPLETLILIFTAGLMAYATVQHATSALENPIDKVQFIFAGITALIIPFAFFQILMMQATTESDFIWALKANLSAGLLIGALLPWFAAIYTQRKTLWHWVLSLASLSLAIANLWQPYSLQYNLFSGISSKQMPWGETYTDGIGTSGSLSYVAATVVVLIYIYCLYAFWRHYRHKCRWVDLILFLAFTLSFIATIIGILIRLSILDWILPGPVGFIGMVLAMSIALSINKNHRLQSSEKRFRTLIEQSSFGIQLVSVHGNIELTNPAWQKMRGLIANDFDQGPISRDHYVLRQGLMPFIHRGFAGESVDIPPLRWETPEPNAEYHSNATRWIQTKIGPIRDENGSVSHIILVHEDVTEEQQVETAIHKIAAGVASPSDQQFFQQMVVSLVELFHVDAAFIGALDETDPQKLTTLALYSGGTLQENLRNYPFDAKFNCLNPNQQLADVSDAPAVCPVPDLLAQIGIQHYRCAMLCDNKNEPTGLLVLLNRSPANLSKINPDILAIFVARAGAEVQQIKADQHIRQLAYEDYLTGLSNRALFHQRLSQTLAEARSSMHLGALLLIDLDHFKTINDALGHDVGDDVLKAVAIRTKEATDEKTLLARFGGDEFVALMLLDTTVIDTAEQLASKTAKHILDALKAPLSVNGRDFSVGASIGVVVFPQENETELDILRHADMALYKAKKHGRNNVQLFNPSLQIAATTRLKLEEGLRAAVGNNELSLNYQPQVNIDGCCIGVEALLRWHHPELGVVSPDEFIPIAEETGLIHPIGLWVLEQACKDLSRWHENGIPFQGHMAVNVSPWQLISTNFVNEIKQIVEQYPLDPKRIMLEVTESTLLHNRYESIAKLEQLRHLGFKISLDDFGTGYSSLSYLKDIPLDQLKIDKSFIDELEKTDDEQPLLASIYAIGIHMHLAIIAEGVETQNQCERLISMGGKAFQGYLFSKPLTELDLIAWLRGTQRTR